MIAHGSTPASLSRRSLWRFSLRELLLLTTTVAALLAVASLYYRNSRAYQRTPLVERLTDRSALAAACRKLGYPPPASASASGPTSDWDGQQSHQEFTIDVPPKGRVAVLDELSKEIYKILRDGQIDSCRNLRKNDATGTQAIQFSYRIGQAAGSIAVHSADGPEGTRLSVFVQEHKTVR